MSKKLKVAIILPNILPVPAVKGGATETLIENLVIENEINNNIDLTIYSRYDEQAEQESFKYGNSKFIYINENKISGKIYTLYKRILRRLIGVNIKSYYIKSILKDINRKNYDRLIVEGDRFFVEPLKKNKKGLEIYLHIHHDALKEGSENIINNCKKIIVVSEYIKRKTLDVNNVDKSKIMVLKNTVDTNKFNKIKYKDKKVEIKKRFGINDNDIVISFTGRLIPEKGIRELILAFKKLSLKENIKLLIIGSSNFGLKIKNDYEYEIENLCEDLKDKVIFTGYIHNDKIPEIHSIVDIAVVPSRCNEAAGLVVLEARSSGIPLITTNSGGIPEYVNKESSIIINNDDNIVNNLYNSINELINNKGKRVSMANKARDNIYLNDNKYYYKNFINILEGI